MQAHFYTSYWMLDSWHKGYEGIKVWSNREDEDDILISFNIFDYKIEKDDLYGNEYIITERY